MIRKALLSLLMAVGTPTLPLGAPAHPVMFFDVRRYPTILTMIVDEAGRQGVPPHLALGVAWRESRFDPAALNKRSGAAGMFQLMPHTVRVLHVVDPFDARQGAIAGIGVLSWGLGLCGSEAGALRYFATGRCKFQTGETQ